MDDLPTPCCCNLHTANCCPTHYIPAYDPSDDYDYRGYYELKMLAEDTAEREYYQKYLDEDVENNTRWER